MTAGCGMRRLVINSLVSSTRTRTSLLSCGDSLARHAQLYWTAVASPDLDIQGFSHRLFFFSPRQFDLRRNHNTCHGMVVIASPGKSCSHPFWVNSTQDDTKTGGSWCQKRWVLCCSKPGLQDTARHIKKLRHWRQENMHKQRFSKQKEADSTEPHILGEPETDKWVIKILFVKHNIWDISVGPRGCPS